MPYTLEVCVDSTASALAAMQGGAHRLELCADLVIGGTTPSLALLQQVKAETGLPVRALLRPRFGDFCYDRWELAQMARPTSSRSERTFTPTRPSRNVESESSSRISTASRWSGSTACCPRSRASESAACSASCALMVRVLMFIICNF